MSLRKAWESVTPRADVTWEQFQALNAEVHDVTVDGKDVGAILVIGPEIHACITPDGFGRWCSRRLAPILDNVIEKHGFATTGVTVENEVGKRFIERMGFMHEKTENGIMRYKRMVKYGR